MNDLARSLLVFQDAIVAGAKANGGNLEGREIRWQVANPKRPGSERIRLQVWRDRVRVFESSFSRAEIESWLGDPDFKTNIAIAIGSVASLRGTAPAEQPIADPVRACAPLRATQAAAPPGGMPVSEVRADISIQFPSGSLTKP